MHRRILDADGVLWDVWDVHPSWGERRSGDRRRGGPDRRGALRRDAVHDRRRGRDRRRVSHVRIAMRGGLNSGWLAFENDRERRRLAPIPDGWEELPDAELLRLAVDAEPVARPRGRLIE